jgi:hypothetical protein
MTGPVTFPRSADESGRLAIERDERVRDKAALHRLAADTYDVQAQLLRELAEINGLGRIAGENRLHRKLANVYETLRNLLHETATLYEEEADAAPGRPVDSHACAGCGRAGWIPEEAPVGSERGVALHWQLRGAWVCYECWGRGGGRRALPIGDDAATLKELTDLLQLRVRETPVNALRALIAREANAVALAEELRTKLEGCREWRRMHEATGAFDVLARIRRMGYVVAVHNDYRQDGALRTFWLFTRNGLAVKGEGVSDEEALLEVEKKVVRTEERRQ